MVVSDCIVLHPPQPYKYFQYTKIVRLLLKSYLTATLVVNPQHVSWVQGLYHDLHNANKITIRSFDFEKVNNDELHMLLSNESSDIKGYEEYDGVRSILDPCRNRIETVEKFTMTSIFVLYTEDFIVDRPSSYLDVQMVLARDLFSETAVMNQLKKIIPSKFAIISDDKHKKVCHENEINCINIKKLFPKNNRVTFWIPLLQKAAFIVVTDDEVAAFVYILQNEKINDEFMLNKSKTVYFVSPSKNTQQYYPYDSWKFISL